MGGCEWVAEISVLVVLNRERSRVCDNNHSPNIIVSVQNRANFFQNMTIYVKNV